MRQKMMENEPQLAQVFHFDLYGKREAKYDFLNENSLKSIEWNNLQPEAPNFFLVKKDFDQSGMYELGFKIDELFVQNNTGLNTEFDELAIQDSKKDAEEILKLLKTESEIEIINFLGFKLEKVQKIKQAILDIKNNKPKIIKIKIKPFEEKYTIYTGKSNGIMGRPRHEIMKQLLNGENLGLISMRQYAFDVPYHCYTFLSKEIVTSRLFISNKGYCSVFPLYLYPEENSQDLFAKTERTPNLNQAIIDKLAEGLGLKFTPEKENTKGTFAPIDVLDYIYAVLHSPAYREK